MRILRRKCDLADRWDGFRPAVDDAEGHAPDLQGLLADEQHVGNAIHRMVSKGATILFFIKFSFDPCFLPLAHQLNFFFEIKIRSSHKFHHKAGPSDASSEALYGTMGVSLCSVEVIYILRNRVPSHFGWPRQVI